MKRLFSKRQRMILAAASGGKCTECGTKLTKENFHADHVQPWSKGGKTVTNNGAALCASCNLRKGSKEMKKSNMRAWQETALQLALAKYKTERNFAVNAAPGAGKTFFAIMLANELLQQNVIDRVVVIAPRRQIATQWKREFHQITKRPMEAVTGSTFVEYDVEDIHPDMVFTWQAVSGMKDVLQAICKTSRVLVIGDEVHHAAMGAIWGDSAGRFLEDAKHALALTGTPIRGDGKEVLWLEGEQPDYVVSYGYAVDQSWCVPVTFARHKGTFEVDCDGHSVTISESATIIPPSLKEAMRGELKSKLSFERIIKQPFEKDGAPAIESYHADILRDANEKLDILRSREYGEFGMPDAGALIISNSIAMAKYYTALIKKLWPEEEPVMVTSEGGKGGKEINRYAKANTKWIVSVNMISEGVDIPRLRVLVMMPNAQTELYFRQAIGRIIRKNNRFGDPAKDNSRAYCVIPEVKDFVKYALSIESDMAELEDEEAGPKEPTTPPSEWECSTWSDEGCGAINICGTSCHACGMDRNKPYKIDIMQAYGEQEGGIAREVEITAEEMEMAEKHGEDFRRFVLESNDPRAMKIASLLPEEMHAVVGEMWTRVKAQKEGKARG